MEFNQATNHGNSDIALFKGVTAVKKCGVKQRKLAKSKLRRNTGNYLATVF